ncbi:WCRKC thioredoxin 2 [Perilla frutescens var. frutescens]|nr:WCRKC thioredoxin 2 [Perilla frutescens var. frutescens]
MEILPSVKTQYSRIPPSHSPCCSVNSNRKSIFFNGEANPISRNNRNFIQMKGRKLVLSSSYDEGVPIAQQGLENLPISMNLVPISSESQFDRVVAEAQQLDEPIVILWMASWCRKCIYLKPKLEKLAADYYPRVRFYSVDVNNVPHKLVVRAEVTKMPTIQLWRDGKKQAEVIGGHKAYLVMNEVREIIENENSL